MWEFCVAGLPKNGWKFTLLVKPCGACYLNNHSSYDEASYRYFTDICKFKSWTVLYKGVKDFYAKNVKLSF